MPELAQNFLLNPVTAIAFSPEDLAVPLVLLGEGSSVKVFDRKTSNLVDAFRVFRSQSVHGIDCVVEESAFEDHDEPGKRLRCLIWGGRSVISSTLYIEQSAENLCVRCQFRIKETFAEDWILHGSQSPSRLWTDGFEAPFLQAALVTAQNELFCLHLSRVFESDELLSARLDHTSSGPSSTLFCAQCVWNSDSELVVAAGTMFGEILLWKTAVQKAARMASNHSAGRLLQSMLGHEGSIFGLHLAAVRTETGKSISLLASCSDDRMVRVWNVTQSCNAGPSAGIVVERTSDTGFQDSHYNNSSSIASAMGHLSRIWSVRIAQMVRGIVLVFSYGEDGTIQTWRLNKSALENTSDIDGKSTRLLDHVSTSETHSGKNIWSAEIQYRNDGDIAVASGGADGRAVLQIPVKDPSVNYWRHHFSRLSELKTEDSSLTKKEQPGSTQAIFNAMKGTWTLRREIVSALSSYPSGTYEGTAIITERPSTDKEYDQELLYAERGKFRMSNGMILEGSRSYAYRYQQATNRITAWFVTLDKDAEVDYLFHQVTFDSKQPIVDRACDVVASGYHLCIKDDYNAEYAFPFHDNRLDTWSLKYIVKGPAKDYTASATFSRVNEPTVPDENENIDLSSGPVVQENIKSIKAYCWIDPSKVLATTPTGHVLLGPLSHQQFVENTGNEADQDKNIDWSIVRHDEFLRAPPCMTLIPGYGAAIAGTAGSLWIYDISSNIITNIGSFNDRIANIFVFALESNGMQYFATLATFLGVDTASIMLFTKTDLSTASEKSHHTLQLPSGSHVTSACYMEFANLLLIGFRSGTICIYEWSPTSEHSQSVDPCATFYRIHNKDTVTSIRLLPSDMNSSNRIFYILTTGRDGHVAVHQISLDLSKGLDIKLTQVHESQPPFGPMIEGASIDTISKDIIAWGFKSKEFVAWNLTQQKAVMRVDCGGAYRSWSFMLNNDGNSGGSFIWTKASESHAITQTLSSHQVLQSGSHGREIKCLASSDLPGRGQLLATGSEDTTIRLSIYHPTVEASERFRTVHILNKHTTGLQQLAWSPDGKYLFSSAGVEEFFVWRLQPIPCFDIGATLVARCPTVSETSSDLRIMDFSIASVSKYATHTAYTITMIYADSTIRTWSYNTTTSTFELLATTIHGTNCLTQITRLGLIPIKDYSQCNIRYELISATDGHIALLPTTFPATTSFTHPPLTTHRIHQSSIKALDTRHLLSSSVLIATGGDDNAFGITLLTLQTGADGQNDEPHFETLLVPKAHVAGITAVKWLSSKTVRHGEKGMGFELEVLSASNDQVLRLWKVEVDSEGAVRINTGGKYSSEVADVACLELLGAIPKSEFYDFEAKEVLLAGIGLEGWKRGD